MRHATIFNPNMLRKFFSLYFVVTWVALTLAAGLFLLESFRVVESRATVLILPKQTLAETAPANIALALGSESFGVRVFARLPDAGVDLTDQTTWKAAVQANVVENSSALQVVVTTDTRHTTEQLMQATLAELGSSLSRWYDIRTALDWRLLDTPQVTSTVSSWPKFLAASLFLALAVTTGFFLLLALAEGLLQMWMKGRVSRPASYFPPETFQPSTHVPYWTHDYAKETSTEHVPLSGPTQPMSEPQVPTVEEESAALETVFQDQTFTMTEPTATRQSVSVTTGRAPDNLPVMEDLSPLEGATARLVRADIDATARQQAAAAATAFVQASMADQISAVRTGEPTQEEYKRRLNELLSGKM